MLSMRTQNAQPTVLYRVISDLHSILKIDELSAM